MITIQAWLAEAYNRLKSRSSTPALDAQVLLAHVLDRPRPWLLAHPETALELVQLAGLEDGLKRLERGEPLPYILGHWEFYGLDLLVTPEVLIPRPETELMVEQALAWLRRQPAWLRHTPAGEHRSCWVADIGTGSGCISIAIARALTGRQGPAEAGAMSVQSIPGPQQDAPAVNVRLVATDFSLGALHVARTNALRCAVADRIDFIQADLLSSFVRPSGRHLGGISGPPTPAAGPFDLICANLPYIPHSTLSGLAVTRYEPLLALDGGPDGLDLVGRLLRMAPPYLAPQAALLLEIEASQGPAARSLAETYFPRAQVEILPDLAGLDRLLFITT